MNATKNNTTAKIINCLARDCALFADGEPLATRVEMVMTAIAHARVVVGPLMRGGH